MVEGQIEPLSERELEIVELLSQGLSNREIAQELIISPNTVKVHLRNVYAKLNVRSRTEATVAAVQMGLIQIDTPAQPEMEAPKPQSVPAEQAMPAQIEVPVKPLALWQRGTLIVAVLLVVLGLWLTWPRSMLSSRPISDLGPQTQSQDLAGGSRWNQLAQMPTARSRLAAALYEGQIYAIAGETLYGVGGMVEIYTIEDDSWARGTDKPTPVANVSAVVLGDEIYVPGGSLSSGAISDQLEIYDPRADAWHAGHPLPQAVCGYALVAYDGQMYLFGGLRDSIYTGESFRYDPGQDQWTALAAMPTSRAFAGAGVIGDRIYVVGGYDGDAELATCQMYDPQVDRWQTCPSMQTPRAGLGAVTIGDNLYVVGGGWENYLVENEYFTPLASNPAEGTWQRYPSPFLQEWRNLSVVGDQGTLYAVGGWSGAGLNVAQSYEAVYRIFLPVSTTGQ